MTKHGRIESIPKWNSIVLMSACLAGARHCVSCGLNFSVFFPYGDKHGSLAPGSRPAGYKDSGLDAEGLYYIRNPIPLAGQSQRRYGDVCHHPWLPTYQQ
jgi:hypothetical protein